MSFYNSKEANSIAVASGIAIGTAQVAGTIVIGSLLGGPLGLVGWGLSAYFCNEAAKRECVIANEALVAYCDQKDGKVRKAKRYPV